jgi:hypothetical protein
MQENTKMFVKSLDPRLKYEVNMIGISVYVSHDWKRIT